VLESDITKDMRFGEPDHDSAWSGVAVVVLEYLQCLINSSPPFTSRSQC
jgi:hypothetical protein